MELSKATLHRYPPSLEATTMGHLDAHRKNTQSTKQMQQCNNNISECFFPIQPSNTTHTHHCFLTTMEPKLIVYMDQTGHIPQPSSQRNNYLMVAYDYDSNNILMRPIKNRSSAQIMEAIADIHHTLAKGGCKAQFHQLDNECSQELKQWLVQPTQCPVSVGTAIRTLQ